MRAKILRRCYDDSLTKHFDIKKIIALIQKKFFWNCMYKNIENYIKKCNVCQQIKTQHYRSYDEFIKFFISKKFWFEIFMNMIIQLSSSKYNNVVYDSIIIIICKYFKITIYLLVKFIITILQICDLFQNKKFLQYDLFDDIVFDKESLFTSNFWSTLCYCVKIKRRLNIAFHS